MLRMGRNTKPDPTPEPEKTGENMSQPPNTSPNSTAYNQPSTGFTPNAGTSASSSSSSPSASSQPLPQMGGGSGVGRAVTENESLARDIKEGALSGFVGGGTTVSGELTFKAMLRVDGHLAGRVASQDGTLIVSAGGQLDADVEVAVAQINGTVNGDVVATKRIELGRVAKIYGNIQTPALVVEQGAIFEGTCRMTHLQEEEDKSKTQIAPTSPTPPPAVTASPAAPPPSPPSPSSASTTDSTNKSANTTTSTAASTATAADDKKPNAASGVKL
ncbi:MAG: polymer-forming cytoskeletal protein [Pyrinomonadaceae bacterium MAG19_C2-C3]|nr:polymer-forming cytoskeletal protein [Pyrinomonadaceae bacterium MAG19_C2-C3]